MPNILGQVITVTASPFTYRNANTGVVEHIMISGGTVSLVQIVEEGIKRTLNTIGIISLNPGAAIVVTYSVAPTMTKILGDLVTAAF